MLEGLEDDTSKRYTETNYHVKQDSRYRSPSRNEVLEDGHKLQSKQSEGFFQGDDLDVTPGVVQNLSLTKQEIMHEV